MKNHEIKINEVSKIEKLKKELDFVELEERLEMVQILSLAAKCSISGGDGSCTTTAPPTK